MQRSKAEKKFSFSVKHADSIQKKIQFTMVRVVAIGMVVLGIVACILNFYSTYEMLRTTMNELSKLVADRVEWEITAYKNIVQELGCVSRFSSDAYTIEDKQEIISQKVQGYGFIRGRLINTEGIAEIDNTDFSDRDFFQHAIKGEVYFSEPTLSPTDGKIRLYAAAPVWENGVANTTITGVIMVVLPLDMLNNIAKDIEISENANAYILNKEGTTIAHTLIERVEIAENTIQDAKTDSSLRKIASLEEKMIAGEDGFGTYTYGGVVKMLSYSPVKNSDGWSVAVNAPIMDFFGKLVFSIFAMIVIVIITIVVASSVAVQTGKKIGEPIRLCANRLNQILEGDLQSEIPVIDTKDEVAILADTTKGIVDGLNAIIGDIKYLLSSMADGDFSIHTKAEQHYIGDFEEILLSVRRIHSSLNGTLLSIREAADQVSAGSDQMAEGAQSLAEGATDQAGAVQELLATISDTTAKVEQNAEEAVEASKEAMQIEKSAQDSTKNMQEVTNAMERISTASKEIENIILTIENIASQTNLLALNASIEAARAGEAGRGFAVVASEIGQLANESAKAVEDTRKLIGTALSEVSDGNGIVENTVAVLMDVINGIEEIVQSIEGVAESSKQQAVAMEEINKGIEQISVVVEANSATAEESSATSEELSAQAAQLKEQVERFKFKNN